MNTNLLDLNNDILNIIGDYVKKDNIEREEKERAFKFVDNELKCIRKDKSMKYPSRPNLRKIIYYTFSLIEVKNEEIINEYLTLKKLNLKYH
jgi:hypothetical protein